MEEMQQIKFDFNASAENKQSKTTIIKDKKLKKIEADLKELQRRVDVICKSLRR